MLSQTAGIILVLCLWNVFDSAQGQTCTFEGECSQLARVHFRCGTFGTSTCVHYFLVYFTCQRTEACTNSFGLWSACTASCTPGGTRTRTRTCTVATGQQCVSTDSEACNVGTPCIRNIDGNWSEWGQWSTTSCSVTCCEGTGPQTRTRTCTNPPPEGTGVTCPGVGTEDRVFACGSNADQCPVVCTAGSQNFADTCQQCVNNYYECDALLNPVVQNCAVGLVWSQGLQACTSPILCALNP